MDACNSESNYIYFFSSMNLVFVLYLYLYIKYLFFLTTVKHASITAHFLEVCGKKLILFSFI